MAMSWKNSIAQIVREGSYPKLKTSRARGRVKTFRIRQNGTVNLGLIREIILSTVSNVESNAKYERDQRSRKLEAE